MEQYGHAAYHGAVSPRDDRKFAVVPPGVNLRIFDASVRGPDDGRISSYLDRMLARDMPPERRNLPAVICSSRLDPKKNHTALVRAFALSGDLRSAANLLIVVRGAPELESAEAVLRSRKGLDATESAVLDKIVEVCETHHLWGTVSAFSLASQNELAAAYRHLSQLHSVFALTALYEPFGLAPLEAIAAGLPAVVTQNGGPSESLYDGATGQEYGVLVDPSDPSDIAAGLLRLVGPDNEWDALQRAGRQRVLARYTWEQTAAGYLAVIEAMMADRLAIPDYFLDPRPETDIGIEFLAANWPARAKHRSPER
jgi:sucrose-phosphate synthase